LNKLGIRVYKSKREVRINNSEIVKVVALHEREYGMEDVGAKKKLISNKTHFLYGINRREGSVMLLRGTLRKIAVPLPHTASCYDFNDAFANKSISFGAEDFRKNFSQENKLTEYR